MNTIIYFTNKMGQNKAFYFFLIAFCALTYAGLSAQQDTSKRYIIFSDTVYIGKYYSIQLADKSEDIGKLVGVNKSSFLMLMDGEIREIDFSEVIRISEYTTTDYSKPELEKGVKARHNTYLGAGITIPYKTKNTRDEFTAGFDLMAGFQVVFNRNFGMRGDFDLVHHPRNDRTEKTPYSKSITTGGSVNALTFRFNFLFGNFIKEAANYYFSIGAGAGFNKRGEINTHYEDYYSGNTTTYDYKSSGEALFLILGFVGGSVNFDISPKIRAFIEPQINFWAGDDVPNFLSLKAGIIL
ncbi:MAG TPA: hypothetical protein VN514_09975 [Ignavibacteria bacterium]|nr:hypothetical protein [Ignavibacteria bacterium]